MIDHFFDVVDVALTEDGDLEITTRVEVRIFKHGDWNGMRVKMRSSKIRDVEVTHAAMNGVKRDW